MDEVAVRSTKKFWERSHWISLLCCWRDGVAAEIRARHSAYRAVGIGCAARSAGGRCAFHDARAGAICNQTPRRNAHVPSRQRVWACDYGVYVIAIDLGVASALAILGAADMVCVVIRISVVQLATPKALRGRVGAVNVLCTNVSSQLGEFESRMTAALFGATPAAVLGGVGTIAAALFWTKLLPALRMVERLE
jgi:hypothetical protein